MYLENLALAINAFMAKAVLVLLFNPSAKADGNRFPLFNDIAQKGKPKPNTNGRTQILHLPTSPNRVRIIQKGALVMATV
jgi:hypothetical protein